MGSIILLLSWRGQKTGGGGGNLGKNKGQRHSKVKGAETGCSFSFSKSTGRFSEGKLIEGLCSAFSPTVHSKLPQAGPWACLGSTLVGLDMCRADQGGKASCLPPESGWSPEMALLT